MTHIVYKSCSTFQKKHIGQYSEGIDVFKYENFDLFVRLFHSF